VIGRLYLCDEPVWGTVYAGVQHVDSLITLGSPHGTWQRADAGWFLGDMANQKAPGAAYDTVRYHPVVGRYIQGRRDGTHKEQRAFHLYRTIGGQGDVWGDGMIPVESAGLDDVRPLVLDGVAHSGKVGRQWYGASAAIIRRWWLDLSSAGLDRG
jgi:hypothetical protein